MNTADKLMKKCAVLVATLTIVLLVLQPASAIMINHVVVKPSKSCVIVSVNYTLDPISALRVFIFGAKAIEKDVTSLFSTNAHFKTLRIGYNYAEFAFPANFSGNITYFKGVNLSKEVNVTIYAGTPINLGKTDKIPPIYFCTSVEKI